MRKFFQIVGALTVGIFLVAAAGIGWAIYSGTTLDTESKAFVDATVSAIAAKWDPATVVERSSPELKEKIEPEKLLSLFGDLARTGPMTKYDGAKGQATMSYFTGTGSRILASYVANAECQNGVATFRFQLRKVGQNWLIDSFYITTKLNPGADRHA